MPSPRVEDLREQIYHLKQRLAEALAAEPLEPVEDWTLETPSGQAALSQLFGERQDMLLIHNMGRSCKYCSMWADGLNGYLPMLEERAAVVLLSPDPPETLAGTAAERGWRFRLASDPGGDALRAFGFLGEDGPMPGATSLRLADGKVFRKASTMFGPGDDFNPVWPLFDLLEGGASGWEPKD
jgi:predicted dithiol-disulfide oxidoreductase (DUF899 family)